MANVFYELRENHIILHNNDEQHDLTESAEECDWCKYDILTCRGNKKGCSCDWFTANIPEMKGG